MHDFKIMQTPHYVGFSQYVPFIFFSDMLLLSQCLAPPTGRAGHTLILVAFLAPAWPIVPNLRCSLFQADTYTR